MRIGIPREVAAGERRVAATPECVVKLLKLGFSIDVERDAGLPAGFTDTAYEAAGATLTNTAEVWSADVVLKVRAPSLDEVAALPARVEGRSAQVLVSFVFPAQQPALLAALSERGVTALAMDCVPRISRAQKMDALSSMANIAGYRAIVEAAAHFGRFFNGQITAAGKVPPARVLVIGAGVAGLAAIAAARSMGAVVRAFDTRPVVKEQVQSLGAEFLEIHLDEDGSGHGGYAREMSPAFIAAEMALFEAQARDVDVIVTTALIPGRPAPRLITRVMVDQMRPGSVVVDLAAEQGGNCELTRPGEAVRHALPAVDGGHTGTVTIIGFTDLTSRMAAQASQLYAQNLVHLLTDLGGAQGFAIDFSDEVVRGATVVKEGVITWPPPPPPPKPAPAAATSTANAYPMGPPVAAPPGSSTAPVSSAATPHVSSTKATAGHGHGHGGHGHGAHGPPPGAGPSSWVLLVAGMVLLGVGVVAPPAFLSHLIVFVLACFIGFQLVWSVTPALHTPLMSVTNAISGIILVGGMLHAGGGAQGSGDTVTTWLGGAAILVATINIAGGFLVTQRMLKMFRKG